MSLQQPPQIPVSIGLAPNQAQGARMVGPIYLTFSGTSISTTGLTNVINDDLVLEGEDGTINNIQAMYFDSSGCAVPVALTIGDTQQTIIIPPKSQGYLPVMATNSMRYSAVGYGGPGVGAFYNVLISFLNVPVNACVWPVTPSFGLASTTVGAGNAQIVTGANNGGFAWGAQNRDIYITGFDIAGNGATAEGPITATLTNIAGLNFGGGTETLSWVVDIPALGTPVSYSRRFEPPLKTIRSGVSAQTSLLTVPAFGAGNTSSSVALYYYLG